MKFNDLFKREKYSQCDDGLRYLVGNKLHSDRINLPSFIMLSGFLISFNCSGMHSTIGPAFTKINGETQYKLNDSEVTKLEVFLS